ncbi:MAG: ketoacyl-ACP synthase III [Gammaproteobacteria bacterium]|jgi:3-oxoacyl-[acyl-carrier-protein] synthase-3
MQSAQIYSVGSELAESTILTRDILDQARFEDCTLVEKSLGISEVRQAPDSSRPSDLAIPAARKALQESTLNPRDVDAVIYCGIERDCSEPATAHIIASALGLRPSICFDVANACHGFVSGIHVANAMIRTGDIRHAVVVTAELSSKVTRRVVDLFRSNKLGPADIRTHVGAFTVGDAGGAMVLGPADEGKGIRQIKSGAVSDHHQLCSYKIDRGNLSFVMDMGRISAVTLKLVKDLIDPAYEALGWTPDDVDQFIPHQVGERPFRKTLEIVGVGEEKSIATYPRLGNLASATIPVCYDLMQKQGRLKPGTNLLIGSSGSGIAATFMGLSL